ncbi:MAG: SET domain-containing protein [Ignavibacteriaceae bacterium]
MRKGIELPHVGVYVRLRPSKIHGVGVFAIRKIQKGIYPFKGENSGLIWLNKKEIQKLPKTIKNLYNDFCIIKNNGELYGAPKNFNLMTTAWYVDDTKVPNLGYDKEYNFYNLRNIEVGEELSVDYSTFTE